MQMGLNPSLSTILSNLLAKVGVKMRSPEGTVGMVDLVSS